MTAEAITGAGTLSSEELRPAPGRRRRPKRYTSTQDFLSMLTRMVAAAGERVGEADVPDLVALAAIEDELHAAIQRGINGLREDGYTWESIGRGFGVTRQAALMRWGRTEKGYIPPPPSATAS